MDSEYVISYDTEWEPKGEECTYSKRGLTNKGNSITMTVTAADIFSMLERRIEELEDRLSGSGDV